MGPRTIVLSVLLLCVAVASVQAGPPQCSAATLQGSFGVFEQGVIVPPGMLLPFVNSGRITYDGTGGMTGTYTLSLGGMMISAR